MSLGTTLLVVALVTTLGFALASLSVTHLNLMSSSSNRLQAKNLADSAVARAMEAVIDDITFGENGLPGDTLTVTQDEAPEGAIGLVSFSTNDAASLGIPFSVNNLSGAGAVPGYKDRMVPVASAHIVGVGRCRGVTRRVEAVLRIPPFPYAVASSVPIVSIGGLYIAGVQSPDDMLDVASGADRDKAVPADLVSNALDAEAVVLGDDTVVTGDAQASGGITVDPGGGTQILGELRPFAEPAGLPRMTPDDLDPAVTGRPYVNLTSVGANPVFEGTVRHEGDMSVDGTMTLDGALVYVDGNLFVSGGVAGDGALVVVGETEIHGNSNLSSEDLVALLSKGDIRLEGTGNTHSFFQGLVYTEGSFFADQVTMLGTLIANPDATDKQVTLKDSQVVYAPELTEVGVTGFNTGGVNLYFNSSGHPMGKAHPSGHEIYVTRDADGVYYLDGVSTGETTVDGAAQAVYARVEGMVGDLSPGTMNALENKIPQAIDSIAPDSGDEEPPAIVTIDPSQFVTLADRVRVVLWREF